MSPIPTIIASLKALHPNTVTSLGFNTGMLEVIDNSVSKWCLTKSVSREREREWKSYKVKCHVNFEFFIPYISLPARKPTHSISWSRCKNSFLHGVKWIAFTTVVRTTLRKCTSWQISYTRILMQCFDHMNGSKIIIFSHGELKWNHYYEIPFRRMSCWHGKTSMVCWVEKESYRRLWKVWFHFCLKIIHVCVISIWYDS